MAFKAITATWNIESEMLHSCTTPDVSHSKAHWFRHFFSHILPYSNSTKCISSLSVAACHCISNLRWYSISNIGLQGGMYISIGQNLSCCIWIYNGVSCINMKCSHKTPLMHSCWCDRLSTWMYNASQALTTLTVKHIGLTSSISECVFLLRYPTGSKLTD